ncbi:hypothetical protein IW150_000651 [Coemansia sp. RSA 2607]|nr:hypothetical protein IW150_000651 [Coemansia sp. RSA 2607]
MDNTEDLAAKERYIKLAKTLQGSAMDLEELIDALGLREHYTEYEKTSVDICNSLIDKIPTLGSGKSRETTVSNQRKEQDLTKWFKNIYYHMVALDFSQCPAAKPLDRYSLQNHENTKAKLAPYECGLPIEVLGQMAYYAQCVWNEQFTRTFVPIIFLHGINMDIYLFACSGNRRVVLGRKIRAFTNVSDLVRFLHFGGQKRYATVKRVDCEKDSTVKVTGRISREVDIWRRAAYLLKVLYQGKDAILKLSWIPVSRQPEGVLYNLMSQGSHGVDYIPKDVFLIDWGYGKVILDALNSSQKKKVNTEWGIDINNLTSNEDARDGMTDTVY